MVNRRQKVAEMYLQGKTQSEIGDVVGVTQHTVSEDLAWLRDQWTAQALIDFDEKKAIELAKIDNLERMAHEAWARSCENAETMNVTREQVLAPTPELTAAAADAHKTAGSATKPLKGMNGTKRKPGMPTSAIPQTLITVKRNVSKTSKGQSGNPAFLERISWCIEIRLKLMGLLKDPKAGSTNNFIQINWDDAAKRPADADWDIEQRIADAALPAPHDQLLPGAPG